MNILGHLGHHFWLSWGTFWLHFDSLGTLFAPILALLGRLGTSWDVLGRLFRLNWPKLAQDNEKKLDF